MKEKRFLPKITALLGSLVIAAHTYAAPLKVGVTPGSLADSVNVAAVEARKVGLEVDVIEFTDWTTPNSALDAKDIDLNYFQHQAFLDNALKERHFKIKSIAVGLLSNIGLYSKKIKSFDELPKGASVGVANDPVNQGRGLLLLEKAGLIKLKDGIGAKASINDIIENPKELKLVEIEGPQLVRAIDDLDLAQGYPGHFVNAGQADIASKALLYSNIDDTYYAIRFVAHTDNVNDERLKKFIEIYHSSDAVKKEIHDSLAQDNKLYSLPWLRNQ